MIFSLVSEGWKYREEDSTRNPWKTVGNINENSDKNKDRNNNKKESAFDKIIDKNKGLNPYSELSKYSYCMKFCVFLLRARQKTLTDL